MKQTDVLTPLRQEFARFYEDEIPAAIVEVEGQQTVYVPLNPICEFLGVNWSGQLQRVRRDPVLSEVARSVTVITDPGESGKGGGPQTLLCLPLDMLHGWLFSLNATRVRPDLQEKIIRYQRECYRALAAAFLKTDIESGSSEEYQVLAQVKEAALAIASLADQQMALTARLDKAALVVGEHGRRITALEQQLAPRNSISDQQAADVAETVKALALLMGENDKSKSHFQQIFSELYRRFRVSSYKLIRQSQYQLVMDFLNEWAEAQKSDHS